MHVQHMGQSHIEINNTTGTTNEVAGVKRNANTPRRPTKFHRGVRIFRQSPCASQDRHTNTGVMADRIPFPQTIHFAVEGRSAW